MEILFESRLARLFRLERALWAELLHKATVHQPRTRRGVAAQPRGGLQIELPENAALPG
jgi:hypothetical protein